MTFFLINAIIALLASAQAASASSGLRQQRRTRQVYASFQSKAELQRATDQFTDGSRLTVENTYGEIRNWDVSSITDFSLLFEFKRNFNEPLDGWDVSNAVTMEGMFSSAYAFNQDISMWNTTQVTNMKYMFSGAESFNQDLDC